MDNLENFHLQGKCQYFLKLNLLRVNTISSLTENWVKSINWEKKEYVKIWKIPQYLWNQCNANLNSDEVFWFLRLAKIRMNNYVHFVEHVGVILF